MAKLVTAGGTKLTRRELRRLAAEAEAGYDVSLDQMEPVGPGRPSLDEGVSPRVSYRVPMTLFEALRVRSLKEGRSMSEIAREALQRYLA